MKIVPLSEVKANLSRYGALCRHEPIVTRHASDRMALWQRTEEQVFETLLFPEEVVTGHRNRFVARRRYGEHVFRIVYEYEEGCPLIITLYFPYAKRYFQGGGSYADQVLS